MLDLPADVSSAAIRPTPLPGPGEDAGWPLNARVVPAVHDHAAPHSQFFAAVPRLYSIPIKAVGAPDHLFEPPGNRTANITWRPQTKLIFGPGGMKARGVGISPPCRPVNYHSWRV